MASRSNQSWRGRYDVGVVVGVVSDTHGLLRASAVEALAGVEMILHAGDVGKREVLEELRRIAPVVAVRGNVDKGEWAQELPETEAIAVGDARVYMLHNLMELDLDPKVSGFQAVVYGHTHRAEQRVKDGVLYLNPGSIGPRRFRLPVSMARLRVGRTRIDVEMMTLAE